MSWTPTVTVTLAGTTVDADRVLDEVTITRGRDGVDVQPRAGYTTLHLLDDGARLDRTALDAKLTVAVDGFTLVDTADVSDAEVELLRYHAGGGIIARHTITATGRLARLHRRGKATTRPAEHDGDRVLALLEPLATLTWTLAPSNPNTAGGWDEVDPATTWEGVDPIPLDVDTPGNYELAALDADTTDPWDALQQAANDGLGVLAELREGGIRYTDAHGRVRRAAADGFLELPGRAIIPAGLSVGTHVGDLATTVRVRYIDPGTGDTVEVTAEDADAVAGRGGVLEHTVDTQLVDDADAQARAERLLNLRSLDTATLEQLHVALDTLDAPLREQLLALEVGTPIRVRDLPPALGSTFTGVVEALTWTVTRHSARLTLTVSTWALSEYALTWELLDPIEAWTALDPTTTWTNAQELIA